MSKHEKERARITLGVSVSVSRDLFKAIEGEFGPGVMGFVRMPRDGAVNEDQSGGSGPDVQ